MLYKGRVFAVTLRVKSQVLYKSQVFEVTSSAVQGSRLRAKCQVLYKSQVFEVTSSVVQGSCVCSYIKCCTRFGCLQLHQVL